MLFFPHCLFWPLSAFPPLLNYLCILFKTGFYVYFKYKCKVINLSVYCIAAVFPEITGIAQHIFLCVQVYKKKLP